MLPGRRAESTRQGGLQRDTGHAEPRHETVESCQSDKPWGQILLRAAQRDDVQTSVKSEERSRNAADIRLPFNTVLGQHGRHKDAPGLCKQLGLQHRQQRNTVNHRHDSRRRYNIHSHQGRRHIQERR